MGKYILADNQELTRFALESLIRSKGENDIYKASDKAGLVQLLKEHENAVVLLDYTLFDFADEDQLLIIAERFVLSDSTFAFFHFPVAGSAPSIRRSTAKQCFCQEHQRVQLPYAGSDVLDSTSGCLSSSLAFILMHEFSFLHARAYEASVRRVLCHAMVALGFPLQG